jgi:hypothetical protein
MKNPHRFSGDEWRLLGGLGEYWIARGERCRHLASEDGKREIPRADAGHGAEWPSRNTGLTGRLNPVVAKEIGSFPHLSDCIWERLAGLADQKSQQLRAPRFQFVGGSGEDRGSLGRRRSRPGRCGRGGS